jgi:hypothetical protein
MDQNTRLNALDKKPNNAVAKIAKLKKGEISILALMKHRHQHRSGNQRNDSSCSICATFSSINTLSNSCTKQTSRQHSPSQN